MARGVRAERRRPRVVRTLAAVVVVLLIVGGSVLLVVGGDDGDGDRAGDEGGPTGTPSTSTSATEGTGEPVVQRRPVGQAWKRVQSAGAGAGVVRLDDSEGTYRSAFGKVGKKPRVDVVPNAGFRSGAITQYFVSVLVWQLIERGVWKPSTKVRSVAPDLWPGRPNLTVAQLLSHTSGMPDVVLGINASIDTNKDLIDTLARERTDRALLDAARLLPWDSDPGAASSFTSTGFVTLGMMLRKQTGKPVAKLIQERIAGPAKLRATTLRLAPGISPPFLRESLVRNDQRVDLAKFHPTLLSHSGALITTPEDLSRFHQALARGTLLKFKTVARMRKAPEGAAQSDIRLGVQRLADPCGNGKFLYGWSGGTFGTLSRSYASLDGSRRVTVAVTGFDFDDRADLNASISELVIDAMTRSCDAADQN